MTKNAPIALFVFKRPEHTRRTLEALARNPEFERSPLFVFCDGPRRAEEAEAVEAARVVVRAFPHPGKTVVEAPANLGLANSIVAGVSRLCSEFGRVIVLEDDLIVATGFLAYMNSALERYAEDDRVMQVSGHMFPVALDSPFVFLPFTTSWGWATWHRAWVKFGATDAASTAEGMGLGERIAFDLGGAYPYFRMLKRTLAGGRDSWAIRWYLTVFRAKGLVLFPARTLVLNEGFDGSGTHCVANENHLGRGDLADSIDGVMPRVAVSDSALHAVRRYLAAERGIARRTIDWALRLI